MSYSGIVGWNAEKLTKCSSGRNENFSKGTSKYHGIVKLRIQPGLRENCTITRQLIIGSLCPSAPPSLFLSLSLLGYIFSYLSLLLIASFSFYRTASAFSWFCYSNDFGFLVYLPCHGSKLGFGGLHMTRNYYHLNRTFHFNYDKKIHDL